MKNLNEYETPLTNAAHEGRAERYLGGTVDFRFAADLERRLALCREALVAMQKDSESPEFVQAYCEIILKATKPKQ